jgi:hypothetical protein
MSPHPNGQMVVRFTRMQRDPDNRESPVTELHGNRKGKCNTNQLVLLGHGIYPVCGSQHLISTGIYFDPKGMTEP